MLPAGTGFAAPSPPPSPLSALSCRPAAALGTHTRTTPQPSLQVLWMPWVGVGGGRGRESLRPKPFP